MEFRSLAGFSPSYCLTPIQAICSLYEYEPYYEAGWQKVSSHFLPTGNLKSVGLDYVGTPSCQLAIIHTTEFVVVSLCCSTSLILNLQGCWTGLKLQYSNQQHNSRTKVSDSDFVPSVCNALCPVSAIYPAVPICAEYKCCLDVIMNLLSSQPLV